MLKIPENLDKFLDAFNRATPGCLRGITIEDSRTGMDQEVIVAVQIGKRQMTTRVAEGAIREAGEMLGEHIGSLLSGRLRIELEKGHRAAAGRVEL